MFQPTARGDVFVHARLYDWVTNVCTLGAASRAYGRAAALLVADRPRRMLDVGTGTGTMAFALKRLMPEAEVHGVDPGEHMLHIARMNGVRTGEVVHFHTGWAQDLPFDDGEFDAVACASVLRHVPAAERVVALNELRRVLRPGGRALIVEVAPPAALARVVRCGGLDPDTCRRLLQRAGFDDVRTGKVTRALVGYAAGRRPRRPADGWQPLNGNRAG